MSKNEHLTDQDLLGIVKLAESEEGQACRDSLMALVDEVRRLRGSEALKISSFAEELLNGFIRLRKKFALLEPMISDEAVAKRWGERGRGIGFDILRRALYFDCLRDAASLAFDRDSRTPSVTRILSLLSSSPEARTIFREDFATWRLRLYRKDESLKIGGHLDAILATEAEEARALFDQRLDSLAKQWEQERKEPWADRVKTARNKLIAHTEMIESTDGKHRAFEPQDLSLKWGDPGTAMSALRDPVLEILLLTTNSSYGIDHLDRQLANIASAFWAPMGSPE